MDEKLGGNFFALQDKRYSCWTKWGNYLSSPEFTIPLLATVAIAIFILNYMPLLPYIAQGAACLWVVSKVAEWLSSQIYPQLEELCPPRIQSVALQGILRCALLYGVSFGIGSAPLSGLVALLLYQESIRASLLVVFTLIQSIPARWRKPLAPLAFGRYEERAQILTQFLLYPAFTAVLYFYSAPTIMCGSPPWVNMSVAIACAAGAKVMESVSLGAQFGYASRQYSNLLKSKRDLDGVQSTGMGQSANPEGSDSSVTSTSKKLLT